MPFNKSKALEEATKLVGQRKLSQAIKQYLAIVEQDPADLSLLNTVGDLCLRDGNIPDALRQFYKLAAAYTHEGFALKAIAIYKKIAKLDARSADPLIKLAELYSSKGLSHESREQYAQALAFCQSHSLPGKALEILGKLIAQDPENAAYRMSLGEFHEAAGRTREAALAYLEAAEIAHRQKNPAAANAALGKASTLDSHNSRALLLEARMAVAGGRFEDVEKLFAGAPELKASREARLILLESYFKAQKVDEAAAVTVEIYRDDPGNFEAVERFTTFCLEANNPDAALAPLGALADLALEQQQAGPLISILRRILQAQPRHVSTLELIYAICERAGGGRSELLKDLGGAFARAHQWASAEKVYRQLLDHADGNPLWQTLLKEALVNQGKTGEEEAETSEALSAPEPAAEPAAVESATLTEPVLESALEPLPTAQAFESLQHPLAAPDRKIEIDFSSEWKEYAAVHMQHEEPAAPGPTSPLEEEERTEVQFYLEYGFFAEARASLEKLEAAYPRHPELAELRKMLEDAQEPEAQPPPITGTPLEAAALEGFEAGLPSVTAQDENAALAGADTVSPDSAEVRIGSFPLGTPERQVQQPNFIEDLRLDLEESFAEPSMAEPFLATLAQTESGASTGSDSFNTAFHDLLAELEMEKEEESAQDTPQAHYNLGVAFREMGLLDEAIGEFQKVVRGVDRQNLPPRFLEACSQLGACFMEKGMPVIAARWYRRALEAPGIDEETILALNYELGLAYEGSGDSKAALEKFSEVYSLNIDYRDVAEKIHLLQHKQR